MSYEVFKIVKINSNIKKFVSGYIGEKVLLKELCFKDREIFKFHFLENMFNFLKKRSLRSHISFYDPFMNQ